MRSDLSRALACALIAVLIAASPATAREADKPVLERRGTAILLRAPPRLLEDDTIEQRLDSGLTTTFILGTVVRDSRRQKAQGAIVIEVRYEAWDEVYWVAAGGPAGNVPPRTLASRAELAAWWSELVLPVVEAATLESDSAWRVTVDLTVHPFSTLERDEARRWFVGSLEAATSSTVENQESAAGEKREAMSAFLKDFLASSIQSDAIYVDRWRYTLDPRAAR